MALYFKNPVYNFNYINSTHVNLFYFFLFFFLSIAPTVRRGLLIITLTDPMDQSNNKRKDLVVSSQV